MVEPTPKSKKAKVTTKKKPKSKSKAEYGSKTIVIEHWVQVNTKSHNPFALMNDYPCGRKISSNKLVFENFASMFKAENLIYVKAKQF
ncbi:hypothetical protein E3N88_12774 [Mikania micrantha]|uniref:Uncharacterized protein n=1 Tax=Mikania micrantha TaxID=192012 RepID=A0A5N6P6I9_9ASTR|nr:hypothetical protein E3N88_12774 [Mikania micrantha]